jgi:Cysteine rich repeat.
MRQRAESVRLLPEVEQACVDDLGMYCPERTGPGQEMDCLQVSFYFVVVVVVVVAALAFAEWR